MTKSRLTMSILGVLGFAAGCDGTSTPAPIPRDRVAAEMAAAICYPGCSSALAGFDPEVCRVAIQPEIEANLAADLAAGGTYNAAAAGRCVADYRAAAGASRERLKTLPINGDCNDVVSGLAGNAKACNEDATCHPGSYCAHDDASRPSGVCTTRGDVHRGKLGDPCCGDEYQDRWGFAMSWGDCSGSPSTFCHGVDGLQCLAGTCVPRAKVGEACGGVGADCVEGAACSSTAGSTVPGTCQALAKVGETCGMGADCEYELTCIDGRCAGPVALGAACSYDHDCESGACLDGKCIEAICGLASLYLSDW